MIYRVNSCTSFSSFLLRSPSFCNSADMLVHGQDTESNPSQGTRQRVSNSTDIAFFIIPKKMILLLNSSSGLRMCLLVSRILKGTAFAALTCLFATVGALVGCAAGALIGQTKEIGCARGARIGAFSGAVLSIEMLESTAVGGQWSLMDIFVSLVNGKIFQEWIGEAMLAANQPQGSMVRSTFDDHLSIFDIGNTRGMLPDSVKKLPTFVFSFQEERKTSGDEIPCAICLQEFGEGDSVRRLPMCRHHFHMGCIDRWLTIDASCPTCRQHVG